MSAEIASDIGLSYDPNIVLNMQSANGTMDRSLGLARNVPCTIGDVTIYLQIHVLRSPAYDILLGRPFDILTRSTVNTISDIETTITITDPNTGLRRTIPTFPRGKTERSLTVNPKHPANPNIHLALWEFFELLNRILQQTKYCGGTFSGHKLVLCALTFKILAVNTLYIAVGYYLCQCASNNRKERRYNCFGSITLNDREARFSQPKLELYGLYQALQALRMYLIGVRNLIIEVDACYIKGMLQNPNIQPSASMNRWIMAILMFHFELVHVKGTFHGPDGLSRRLPQPDDPPVDNSDNSVYEDWIDLTYLAKKYNLHHIRISGYNKRANGIVEQPHFDVRQALFKAVNGDQFRWSTATYSVFWSERVTVRKQMGCSPYYATTSTHPLLPADIVEATYLQPPPNSLLSTTDLIACQAIDLQRRQEDLDRLHSQVLSARRLATICFEKDHAATIRDYNFKTGDLVLMRNTRIEVTHNKKMKPRYLGPLVVISRNRGGAYILCELDGSVLHRPVAAFRLIPYLAREHITVPSATFDIDTSRLRELEQTKFVDDHDTGENASEEENYLLLGLSDKS
ncbi:hypothetical protein J132_02360 [Termitomyces sp. J132]|nr:hypothetical protein J132_02360 [Termitomyces sp. J132]